MKRYSRLLLALLVVVLLAGGGYWLVTTRLMPSSKASSSSGTFTQIVQVKQGSLDSTISVVGELDSLQSEDLSFSRMSGSAKLAKLNAAAGSSVKKGDVLATIDPAPYQQAVDEASSALQAAQKTLADLQAPATALEKAQSDLALAQANYDLLKAQQDLADLQSPDLTTLQNAVQDAQDNLKLAELNVTIAERDSLAKSERDLLYSEDWYTRSIRDLQALPRPNLEQQQMVITRTNQLAESQSDLSRVQAQKQLELQSKQAAKAQAKAALEEAQKSLATAQAGGDTLDVAKAKLAIQTAQVALAKAKDDRVKLDSGAGATDLAKAKSELDKKQLALTDAQAALAGCQLIASFDGTVLKANVHTDDLVSANTTILTIANLKELQVVASIDETTIKRVAAGQSAQITFDAFPGQTFWGKVQSVPLQGSLQNDVMVYEVPISLEGADKVALLVGMTANVKIQTSAVSNALLVPTMALQKVNGMYQVLVASTDDPKGPTTGVPVEVGLSDGTYTQITKGLNVGDRVVVEMTSSSNQSNNGRQGGFGGGIFIQGGGPPPGK